MFVLGYSRVKFARSTASKMRPKLWTCIRVVFGLVSAPLKLVDKMKSAVDWHALREHVMFSGAFMDSCEHYGSLPVAASVCWASLKHKGESGVKHLKGSFHTGREFTDLAPTSMRRLTSGAVRCGERARAGRHQRAAHRPVGARCGGGAIPRFDTRQLLIRNVHGNGKLPPGLRWSSAPPSAVGRLSHVLTQRLAVGREVEVFSTGEVIALGARARIELSGIRWRSAARATIRTAGTGYRHVHAHTSAPYCAAPVVQSRSQVEYERPPESA